MRDLRRSLPIAAAAAGALLFLLLGPSAAAGKSATYDEAVHLLAGWRFLAAGDHGFNHEHPPLMKAVAAAPLIFLGAAAPLEPWTYGREYDQWPLSHAWLHHANDPDRLLRLGRFPIAIVGAALVAVVALAAGGLLRAAGAAPAALGAGAAAFLAATEPNLLAHGSLVTTDMGMAFFWLACALSFWRYLETRAAGWLAMTALVWGLALAAKFTAVLVGPLFLVMGGIHVLAAGTHRRRAGRKQAAKASPPSAAGPVAGPSLVSTIRGAWSSPLYWGRKAEGPWSHLLVSLAAAAVLALVVLNTVYGFDGTFTSLGGMKLESPSFRHLAAGGAGSIPLPLPVPWVQGYDHAEAGGQRWWSYLMGRHSMTGWRHYYLVALLVKTSIPLLLLAAAGATLGRRLVPGLRLLLIGAAPVLLLAAFTFSTSLKNIGARYILPVHAFLALFGGLGAVALALRWRRAGAAAAAALLLWAGVAEARLWPDHLAYFNELAGGPDGGHRWLLDSNLDWGQDLKGLGAWMRANDVPAVHLDYFGTACPRAYGVRTTREFEGGWLAVSATNLAGVYRDDKERYDFLRGVAPAASIGHSILVWNVPRPPGWKPLPGGPPE